MTLIPYWAIIKDSFREAVSSRVLWIILSLITLTHLAFLPLTFLEVQSVGIRTGDVKDWPALIAQLLEEKSDSRANPSKHIWSMLSESAREKIASLTPPKGNSFRAKQAYEREINEIIGDFEKLLADDKFYDKKSFNDVSLSFEGISLASGDISKLAPIDRQRLNRVAFEAAFAGLVEASPPTSLQFRYLIWDILFPLPVSKTQLTQTVLTNLPWLIDKGLLSIGLLVAILVTAPIIPQTFEPGSLHLLLSKPISRSMLYVTKFFGGCAFIMVSSIYLFAGLWLIFGSRLGIWEHRLLWCIPLYTFVFAVYYSVSSLAGLIWRNTIVSIAVTMIFWATCWSVGVSKDSMAGVITKFRLQRLIEVDNQLMSVDESNFPAIFDKKLNRWRPVMMSQEQVELRPYAMLIPAVRPTIGPVYDAKNNRVLSATFSIRSTGQMVLAQGDPSQDYRYQAGPVAPVNSLAILPSREGAPLLVTSYGIQRIDGPMQSKESKPVKFFGFAVPLTGRGPTRELGPSPVPNWAPPAAASIDETDDTLAIYARGNVVIAKLGDDKNYEVAVETSLEGEPKQTGRLDITKAGVLVGRANGKIQWLDRATLKEIESFTPEGKNQTRSIDASPDGRYFSVLFHHGKLWIFDTQSKKLALASVLGQGDISVATWTSRGTLLVADRTSRVSEYDIAKNKLVERYSPPLEMMEWSYRYVLTPVYLLCPKPGEFYKTVQYLLTEQETTAQGESDENAQEQLHPWRPVTSSALFMLAILAVGCVYIHRQEF